MSKMKKNIYRPACQPATIRKHNAHSHIGAQMLNIDGNGVLERCVTLLIDPKRLTACVLAVNVQR